MRYYKKSWLKKRKLQLNRNEMREYNEIRWQSNTRLRK